MIRSIIGYNNSIYSTTNLTLLQLLLDYISTQNPFDLYLNSRFFQQCNIKHKNRIKLFFSEIDKKIENLKKNQRNKQSEQTVFTVVFKSNL